VILSGRQESMMTRWEQQPDGNWQGFSGELAVATVTRDDEEAERWLWTITALKRPKGRRKGAGHRTSWLDARGAADDYWNRWLEATALRPDLQRLASASIKAEGSPAKKRTATKTPARKSTAVKRG
jgi:hypothetical protein